MNQIAILPAGCLVSSKDILFSNEHHVIYSSNLAVYVLNAQTFIIEKIIAVSERTIASIAVSPHNHNLLIATGCDGYLSLWKLNEEELVCRVSVQANTGFLLAWDPFSPDHCAVLMNQPNMRLLYWDMKKAGAGLSELFVIKNQTVQVSVIRWNVLTPGLLAAGCNNGWVILFQTSTKSQKILSVADRTSGVTDVQWDRLSAVYLLVAYQTCISLWDTDSLTEIHTFDKQGGGITAIAWMDWTAGNFVSANSKNGYLRVWNASQRQPLESVRVATGGLVTVYFGTGTKRAICACMDGSVVVYHMVKMQMEYCTAAGHTETIFDCSFSPASPDILATASYDGTVKLWNVPDLTLTRTLHNSREKCIVYSCDWSPKGNMLVGCNSIGSIIIWDVQSGYELTRYSHHTKAVYCVAWNKLDENMVASTSGDCTLVVMEVSLDPKDACSVVTGSASQPSRIRLGVVAPKGQKKSSTTEGVVTPTEIKFKFTHPAPVFGCAWSKHSSSLLATCCLDSNVRVFDCAQQGKAAVRHLLQGHTARAFVAVWSPLLPGTIATGSDDQTVLLWRVDLEGDVDSKAASAATLPPLQRLLGHTSNIRALAWSYELKHLMLSGSWDSSIRLWDARTGTCLHVVTDHSADVYAIASHPNRPFTFMSCSRDTTVRLWELSSVFDRMRMQAVFDCGLHNLIEGDEAGGAGGKREMGTKDSSDDGMITGEEFLRAVVVGGAGTCYTESLPFPLLSGRGSRMLNKDLMRLDATSSNPLPNRLGSRDRALNMLAYSTVSERIFLAQKFHKIFNFFCGANGSLDVMDGVLTLLALALSREKEGRVGGLEGGAVKGSCSALTTADVAAVMAVVRSSQQRLILHESEIIPRARTEARMGESARMGSKRGDISGKAEEQMRKAALLHARLGDFSKYCAIMVDLGEWTAALALAPCVSQEYWKELATRYAHHLAGTSSEQCVPYLVGVGNDAEAVDFYLQRKDIASALALAKMSEGRKDPPVQLPTRDLDDNLNGVGQSAEATFSLASIITAINREEKEDAAKLSAKDRPSIKRDLVLAVNAQAASLYLASSRPMHAAAQSLAVGDVDSAVRILSACGEHDLAYAVSLCMDLNCDICLIRLADLMTAHHALPEALQLLDAIGGAGHRDGGKDLAVGRKASPLGTINGGELSRAALDEFIVEEKGLLLSKSCSRHPCDPSDRDSAQGGRQPKTPQVWISKAKEEEAIGCDSEAAIAYVLGRQYAQAAALAVTAMKKQIREPLELNNGFRRMLRGLKYLRASELDDPLKTQFLSCMFWFCAHEAAEMGLWETGWCMLKVLRNGAQKVPGVNGFPLSASEIKYQELIFKVIGCRLSALSLLDEILSNTTQSSDTGSGSSSSSSSGGGLTPLLTEKLKGRGSADECDEGVGVKELFRPAPSSPTYPTTTRENKEEGARKGSAPSWTEQAAGALRTLGKMVTSSADDKGQASPPRGRTPHSRGSGHFSRTSDEDFTPPPPEIADILRKLRVLLLDAGNTVAVKPSIGAVSPTRHPSYPRAVPSRLSPAVPDRRSSFSTERKPSSGGLQGDRDRGDVAWAATEELYRQVQRLSNALSLPSMTLLLQPSLKGSKANLADKTSSSSGGRTVGGVKPLVRESFYSADIIAKGSLLPVANLHSKLLESCISGMAIQGAVVDLSCNRTRIRTQDTNDSSDSKMSESCDVQRDIDGGGVWGAYSYRDLPYLAGVNEALAWLRVLPFLPNMSGEFIRYT